MGSCCSSTVPEDFLIRPEHIRDLECSICLETIKRDAEQQYGLLENCNHSFCLTCIQKWRESRTYSSIQNACPECMVTSKLMVPSQEWPLNRHHKLLIINEHKQKLAKIPCENFMRGSCEDGNDCLFLHTDSESFLIPMGRMFGYEFVYVIVHRPNLLTFSLRTRKIT